MTLEELYAKALARDAEAIRARSGIATRRTPAHAASIEKNHATHMAKVASAKARFGPMVLDFLREKPLATTIELANAVGVSRCTVARILPTMQNDGAIERRGTCNMHRWVIAGAGQ